MSYIKNRLDELIEIYRKETGFTEYDARMIAERLVADYHNHIVDNAIKENDMAGDFHPDAVVIPLFKLQDTNPKE